jgi:hypothetical protein
MSKLSLKLFEAERRLTRRRPRVDVLQGTADRDAPRPLSDPSKLGNVCWATDMEGRPCLTLLTGNQNAMVGCALVNT